MSTDTLDTSGVVQVRVPRRGPVHDLRAIKVVWQREVIRFARDRTRMIASLVQPLLFLFILGTGLASLMPEGPGGVDLRTFIFPGVLAMTVIFTAMFSAASVVWDREFGFLREMLVAPVGRASIVIGKCLGGATTATLQGVVLLLLAGLVDVPYSPTLMITLVAEMALLAFTLTAAGVLMAARMKNIQSFMGIMQMGLMPMFFLSGALFPLSNLPTWLGGLTRINPITYAVDPMRHAVFAHVDGGAAGPLGAGVTWGGWPVPVGLELGIVVAAGLAMVGLAVLRFRRAD